MFIGSRAKSKNLGRAYPNKCPYCENEVYYDLIRLKKRFWFFLPLSSEIQYYLACPVCDYGVELNDKANKYAKQISTDTDRYLDGEIDEQEYTDSLEEFDHALGVNRQYTAQISGGDGAGAADGEPRGFQ